MVNAILKALMERRSIRQFQDRNIDLESIDTILRAATWAPSANNDQPWKFVVVKDAEIKMKIKDALMAKMTPYYEAEDVPVDRMEAYWTSMFKAPVHIFAFFDSSAMDIEEDWRELQKLWGAQSVSAACQNMLLAAHALGLGSLWIGASLAVEEQIKSMLGVPDDIKMMSVIAIGYPDQKVLPRIRKPISDVTFAERWGEKKIGQ